MLREMLTFLPHGMLGFSEGSGGSDSLSTASSEGEGKSDGCDDGGGGAPNHHGGKGRFACVAVRARDVTYASLPAGWLAWVAELSLPQRWWLAGLSIAPPVAAGFEVASDCRDGPYEALVAAGQTNPSIARLMAYFDGLVNEEFMDEDDDEEAEEEWPFFRGGGGIGRGGSFDWYFHLSDDGMNDGAFRKEMFELPVMFIALGLLSNVRIEELLAATLDRVRWSFIFDYEKNPINLPWSAFHATQPNTLLIDPLFSFASWAKPVLLIPDDRYTLTAAVKQDARALVFGSPETQSDLDLAIAAVTQNGLVLEHLSEEISHDRRVVLAAVKQSGYALRHAPMWLTGDRDLVAEAVRRNGLALKYAQKNLQSDRGIVMIAVKARDCNMDGLDDDYNDEHLDSPLQFASSKLRGDRDVVIAAVRRLGLALAHAHTNLQKDRSVVMIAVRDEGEALEFASDDLKGDRVLVLEAVTQNGDALYHAAEEMTADRGIVLAAVRQDGEALRHASEELKADPFIAKEAIMQSMRCSASFDYTCLAHQIPQELWGDRSFVLELVEHGAHVLSQVEDLVEDREFMLLAVQRNGLALSFASDEIQADRIVVMEAVKHNGLAIRYAVNFRSEPEVALAAIQQNIEALDFVSGLWSNRSFALAATKVLAASQQFTPDDVFG